MVNWSQESILVTGGTGSFGKKFVEIMLRDYRPQRLVVFSRDELKQQNDKLQAQLKAPKTKKKASRKHHHS